MSGDSNPEAGNLGDVKEQNIPTRVTRSPSPEQQLQNVAPLVESTNTISEATKQAGKAAIVSTSLLAALIILVVAIQIWMVESKYSGALSEDFLAGLCAPATSACTDSVLRNLLEQDAQNLRTDRFRTAVMARLIAHTVAEVVALVLVVLGAVLVFDRIESSRRQGGSIETNGSGFWGGLKKMVFQSTFPGVLLCLMGTVVIIWSLKIIADPESRLTIWDRPVFISDYNFLRNNIQPIPGLYLSSGQRPGTAPATGGVSPLPADLMNGISDDLESTD